ncbi:MAG: NYN domain-containing protein [Chthoniobacterales bacterium]
MAERYLIVDGHSVIFGWPYLRAKHDRNTAVAREELVRLLRDYQDTSSVNVVLVFDGQGSEVSQENDPGGIQIFYSRANQTADSIIERLVAKYGSRYQMTIATSDRAIQQTAISFEGGFITVDELQTLLDDTAAQFARELKKRNKR